MGDFFLDVFNAAIIAGWLVLAVLLARLLLKNAPAWAKCTLWAVVGLRLIWPFEIESVLSLVPSAQTLPPAALHDPLPQIHSGLAFVNSAVNPTFTQTFRPEPAASINPLQIAVSAASVVWILGMIAMAVYAAVGYFRLHRRVRVSMPVGEGVYLCDAVSTPFILGLIKPKIYLPSELPEEQWDAVLSHERAHLARRDHWWKPLAFVLLSVFWFHPLLWLAYILLCRDVELACDEKVVKALSAEEKKAYSETLLACSLRRSWITACPLAFGESGVKQRIKAVLHYKKPTLWILIAALIIGSVLAVCFLTQPAEQSDDPAIITAKDVAGKQYIYTKPGAGSEFYINVYDDGTFEYYAGWYSSHIGLGDWEVKEDKLYLYDNTLHVPKTFAFSVKKDALVYLAEESDPFAYVNVANGDLFCYAGKIDPPQKNLTFLKLQEKRGEYFLAVDGQGITWRVQYPSDHLSAELTQFWVSYYGEPRKLENEDAQYEIQAIECWLYREDHGENGQIFDRCRYDIDEDGVAEDCVLSSNRSENGVFSCLLSVYEGDVFEYTAEFHIKFIFDDHLSGFISSSDAVPAQSDLPYGDVFAFALDGGELVILSPSGYSYQSRGQLQCYRVSFSDGKLKLITE